MSKTFTQRFWILQMTAKPSVSSLPAWKFINLTFFAVLCDLRKRRLVSSPKSVCMARCWLSPRCILCVQLSDNELVSHILLYPWFLCSLCLGSPRIAIRVCWLGGSVIRRQVCVAGEGASKPLESLGKQMAAIFLSHTLLSCTLACTVWQVSMEIMEIGPAIAAYQVWFLAIHRCLCLRWQNSKDWPFLLFYSVLLLGITLTLWAPERNMCMCERAFCLRKIKQILLVASCRVGSCLWSCPTRGRVTPPSSGHQ